MPTIADVFGDKLRPDPQIALQPCQIPIRKKTGPLPRLQFVIEFVGPRSVSAGTAAYLLHPQWFAALGEPQAFVMSTADLEWRPLTANTAGSYDSIAIAWNLLTPKGQFTKKTAEHLFGVADQFAQVIERKAMAMPMPEDIGKAISLITQVQQNFDAGASLLVLPDRRQVSEYELWIWCAQLGLTPNLSEGTFDWIVPSSSLPLFQVSPVSDSEMFTLQGAAAGAQAEGILLGFNVPRNPEPLAAFDGMLQAANYLAGKMPGKVYDEDNRPLSAKAAANMRGEIAGAVDALTSVGFPPGSPESMKLFPG